MKNNTLVRSVLTLAVTAAAMSAGGRTIITDGGNIEAGGADAFRPIHNDVFWDTADGEPLYSQGGGIFRFADPQTGRERYYWYGVRYRGAMDYRNDPTVTVEHAVFDAVTCYSSDNLTDWHYEGDVLTRAEAVPIGSAVSVWPMSVSAAVTHFSSSMATVTVPVC